MSQYVNLPREGYPTEVELIEEEQETQGTEGCPRGQQETKKRARSYWEVLKYYQETLRKIKVMKVPMEGVRSNENQAIENIYH